MIVACPSCHARYRFDEAKLGNRPRARTKCVKCGGPIDIDNPAIGGVTLPPEDVVPPTRPSTPAPKVAPARPVPPPEPAPAPPEPVPPPPVPAARSEQDKTEKRKALRAEDPASSTWSGAAGQAPAHDLPRDRRYSLAVIQGPATGTIFPIASSRVIVGRQGADVVLDDPEASRQHAALEVFSDHAILRDLGSTNGTFVDNDRVDEATLMNHGEFRVGSHVLMFIVTGLE